MRLSDDRINHIAHKVADRLQKDDRVRLLKPINTVRVAIRQAIAQQLLMESQVDQETRKFLSTMKKIEEGSTEWDILYQKTYREHIKKKFRLSE